MKKSDLRKIIKEELLKETSSNDTIKIIRQTLVGMGMKVMISGSQITIEGFKFQGKNYPGVILQISG